MRTVTMKELNAFDEANTDVREVCARLGRMSRAAPEIMATNEPSEALIFGMKSVEAIVAQRDGMFRRFEHAAHNFLGAGKLPQETLEDFFDRVCTMTIEEILAAPGRNGLKLCL